MLNLSLLYLTNVPCFLETLRYSPHSYLLLLSFLRPGLSMVVFLLWFLMPSIAISSVLEEEYLRYNPWAMKCFWCGSEWWGNRWLSLGRAGGVGRNKGVWGPGLLLTSDVGSIAWVLRLDLSVRDLSF
jgi:hypothetical protein